MSIFVDMSFLQAEMEDLVVEGKLGSDDESLNTWFIQKVTGQDFNVYLKNRYIAFINATGKEGGDKITRGSAEASFSAWKGNITKLSLYSAILFLEFLRKLKKLECKGQGASLVSFSKAAEVNNADKMVSQRRSPSDCVP